MAFRELASGKGGANPLRQLTQNFDRERISRGEEAGASGTRRYEPSELEQEFFGSALHQPREREQISNRLAEQMSGMTLPQRATRWEEEFLENSKIQQIMKDVENGETLFKELLPQEVQILSKKYVLEEIDENIYRILRRDIADIKNHLQPLGVRERAKYKSVVEDFSDSGLYTDFRDFIFEHQLTGGNGRILPLEILLRKFQNDENELKSYLMLNLV